MKDRGTACDISGQRRSANKDYDHSQQQELAMNTNDLPTLGVLILSTQWEKVPAYGSLCT